MKVAGEALTRRVAGAWFAVRLLKAELPDPHAQLTGLTAQGLALFAGMPSKKATD
jgi:hypothetical protein